MKEYEIDCLKNENQRLKKQNKELKEKQKTPLILLGMELGVLISQIAILICLILVKLGIGTNWRKKQSKQL